MTQSIGIQVVKRVRERGREKHERKTGIAVASNRSRVSLGILHGFDDTVACLGWILVLPDP